MNSAFWMIGELKTALRSLLEACIPHKLATTVLFETLCNVPNLILHQSFRIWAEILKVIRGLCLLIQG